MKFEKRNWDQTKKENKDFYKGKHSNGALREENALKKFGEEILPREKLMRLGASALSENELLAIILGRGTKEKDVFSLAEELTRFLEKSPATPSLSEILKIRGLGEAKACQVLACLELSGRFLLSLDCETIDSPEKALPQFAFLKREPQENFAMISLNGASRLIKKHLLTKGTVNQAPVHPREAFVKAIEDRAVSVIFAHNHPSGSLNASNEDLKVTKNLFSAGEILGIFMQDHLIVGPSGFLSIRRHYPHLFEKQKNG